MESGRRLAPPRRSADRARGLRGAEFNGSGQTVHSCSWWLDGVEERRVTERRGVRGSQGLKNEFGIMLRRPRALRLPARGVCLTINFTPIYISCAALSERPFWHVSSCRSLIGTAGENQQRSCVQLRHARSLRLDVLGLAFAAESLRLGLKIRGCGLRQKGRSLAHKTQHR